MNTIIKNGIEYSIRHTLPCWEQTRGGYGSEYWEVYSPKLGRDVKLYSNVEWEHWLLLESDPNVVYFCEQPVRMLTLVGEKGSSFIDMWVLFADHTEEYREIKVSEDVDSDRSKKQIQIQKSWCERNNFVHRVVTELDLKKFKQQIESCKEFIGFIPHKISERHLKLQRSVTDIVVSHGQIKFIELVEKFVGSSEQQVLSTIFTLIHSGVLHAPLDIQRYSKNMLVSIRR